MVKKILMFSVEEAVGGFDFNEIKFSLFEFFESNYPGKFDIILINGVKPFSKEELMELLPK